VLESAIPFTEETLKGHELALPSGVLIEIDRTRVPQLGILVGSPTAQHEQGIEITVLVRSSMSRALAFGCEVEAGWSTIVTVRRAKP
jgi:hypothetical protein